MDAKDIIMQKDVDFRYYTTSSTIKSMVYKKMGYVIDYKYANKLAELFGIPKKIAMKSDGSIYPIYRKRDVESMFTGNNHFPFMDAINKVLDMQREEKRAKKEGEERSENEKIEKEYEEREKILAKYEEKDKNKLFRQEKKKERRKTDMELISDELLLQDEVYYQN